MSASDTNRKWKTSAQTSRGVQKHMENVKQRAAEAEKQEADMMLDNIDSEDILKAQKLFEAQKEQLETLRKQKAILNGTFDSTSAWTASTPRRTAGKSSRRVSELERQIAQREALIMSNQGLKERPAHFLAPRPPNEALSASAPHPPNEARAERQRSNRVSPQKPKKDQSPELQSSPAQAPVEPKKQDKAAPSQERAPARGACNGAAQRRHRR